MSELQAMQRGERNEGRAATISVLRSAGFCLESESTPIFRRPAGFPYTLKKIEAG